MKHYYLHKDKTGVIEVDFELERTFYMIGTTYVDYVAGSWIPLNEMQLDFINSHPSESVQNWIEMRSSNEPEPSPEELLSRAKSAKKAELRLRDASFAVNSFLLYNQQMWIEPSTRAVFKNYLNAKKARGVESVRYRGIDFLTEDALKLIEDIDIYAGDCSIVTQMHNDAIDALDNVDAVMAYNISAGYPPRVEYPIQDIEL